MLLYSCFFCRSSDSSGLWSTCCSTSFWPSLRANRPAKKISLSGQRANYSWKPHRRILLLFFLQIENLQDQLRDKEKQLSGLKDRVKSLQTDTSNTDTALGTLEEALAEKVYTHARTRSADLWLTLEQGCINKTLMSKTADHPHDDQMTLDNMETAQ